MFKRKFNYFFETKEIFLIEFFFQLSSIQNLFLFSLFENSKSFSIVESISSVAAQIPKYMERSDEKKRVGTIDVLNQSKGPSKNRNANDDDDDCELFKSLKTDISVGKVQPPQPSPSIREEENQSILFDELRKLDQTQSSIQCLDEENFSRKGFLLTRSPIVVNKYCSIYPAYQTISNDKNLVCKVIVLRHYDLRARQNILNNSIKILRYLSTSQSDTKPSLLLKIIEIFQIDSKIYLFMEKISNLNDNVLNRIQNHQKINQNQAREWLRSLCDLCYYLHRRGIAHRSIKMENFIVGTERDGPKLTGWSRAVIFFDLENRKILLQDKERKSTELYHMPPECFEQSYNPIDADIWSLGVFLIAIHTRRYVFNVKSKIDFDTQWKSFVQKHRKIHPIVLDLVSRIFIGHDPTKRITLNQLISHEYFTIKELEITNEMLETISSKTDDIGEQNATSSSSSASDSRDQKVDGIQSRNIQSEDDDDRSSIDLEMNDE